MTFALRPIPDDFAELAPTMSFTALKCHYRTGQHTLARWMRATGVRSCNAHVGAPAMPVPDTFRDIAADLDSVTLGRRYGVSKTTVYRWRRETGIKAPTSKLVAPVPDDFTSLAPRMTRVQLMAHYAVGETVLYRWRQESGVSFLPAKRTWNRNTPKVSVIDARDDSLAGRAQQFLQRYQPVFHCRPDGTPDPKGKCFRIGWSILTGDELIARATRKGWNPDAWKELAA